MRDPLKAVSLVVPVHNEEKRLPRFLEKIPVRRFRQAIFVLDGCTDGSEGLVPAGAEKVLFARNRGKGAAVRTGFLLATGKIVCIVDSDGTFSLSQIEKACSEVGKGADIAMAERISFPRKRELLRKGLRLVSRVLFGLKHKDTQCGLIAADKSACRGIFQDLRSTGFEFPVEFFWKAEKLGLKVRKVQVSVPEEDYKNSSFNEIMDPAKMLLALVSLRLKN